MKRYPEYQETGVELISEIPKAWDLTKLKHVAQVDNSGVWGEDQGMLEIDAPVSTTAHLTIDGDWLIEQMPIRSFSKADYEYYSVKNGDIVIVKSSGSATNIITGKAGFIDYLCKSIVFSNFLMRVQPNRDRYEPKFLYYFLISSITKERIKRMVSTTTYPNLKVEEYISNLIPMPSSKDEQIKIAAFLDHKTKHLDELIRIKERKIELLREQRTALINQAVTKGLDPNVEMKPSGVEWVGEIPAHWEIEKIKHIATIVNEKSTPESDAIKLSPENVESKTGKVLDFYSNYDAVGVIFQAGDVLFNKLRVYLSKVVFAEYTGFSLGEMIVIRPSLQCTGKYIFYLMLSCRFIAYCNSMSYGAKMPRTDINDILNAQIPTPTSQEQTEIAHFLDRKTAHIDELISEEKRSIELLKEYRQSLISEAVTGKIDVRSEV